MGLVLPKLKYNLSSTKQDAVSSVVDCVRHSAAAIAASGAPEHAAAPDASAFGGDPVSWRDILQMLPAEARRYKNVTLTELNGLKRKWRCSRASPPIRPFCYLFAFPRRE
jgi:hypothetical protein